MTSVGVEKPDEQAQALQFLDSLHDSRYIDLKLALENEASLGNPRYLKTLFEAYKMASQFKVKVSKASVIGTDESSSVFTTVPVTKVFNHKDSKHKNGTKPVSKKHTTFKSRNHNFIHAQFVIVVSIRHSNVHI